MFEIARDSFKSVETNLRKIYEKDWVINKINKNARLTVVDMINKNILNIMRRYCITS